MNTVVYGRKCLRKNYQVTQRVRVSYTKVYIQQNYVEIESTNEQKEVIPSLCATRRYKCETARRLRIVSGVLRVTGVGQLVFLIQVSLHQLGEIVALNSACLGGFGDMPGMHGELSPEIAGGEIGHDLLLCL